MTLGLLIPEFPAQTHIFFWREARAFEQAGVAVRFVSTRRPPPRLRSHEWSQEAEARTAYVFPPTAGDVVSLLIEALRRGPAAWVRVLRTLMSAGGKRLPRHLVYALLGASVSARARREGWKHLHAHSCADAALLALFAHRWSKLPYSMTLHGPLGDYGPNQPLKWKHAAFAVVITRRLLGEVRAQLAGSLPPEVVIAPMGVELANFARKTPYVPWSGDDAFRVFACGRLNKVKGHGVLMQAVKRLRDGGLPVRAVIAGEDEAGGSGYRRVLEQQRRELGLEDAVELLGAVSETRVKQELEAAHVFALASLHEPLGVALMEAMAMGTPVVSTNAGGVPELIDDGVDGLLVPPSDDVALAEAIRRIADDPSLAARLANAGRGKIATSFHSGLSAETIAHHAKLQPA
jgi:colanic acid/amylovoran biosynthesis glycosyltransferase